MIDIAEFYDVKVLKNACDKYLSNIEYNYENVFHFLEYSDKYFLQESKKSTNAFICKNFWNLLKSESFKSLPKPLMKNVVAPFLNTLRIEELFEAVFKWAEVQALKKQESDENLNVQETIKEEMSDFLPFFKFDQMSIEFLNKFVAKKASFLFSGEKLNEVLSSALGKVYVRIYDENGKIMKGVLNCVEMEKVCDVIESQKNEYNCYCHWPTKQPIPTVPSKLIKRHGIEWYLIYDCFGDLTVVQYSCIGKYHYLLAVMFAEDGFVWKKKCKIEIYRYT
uniref:BACK domain-containing protein n=1 Tax=Panagrolaimus davidi TaxID=227884 RepID=A0A914Q0A9_9BILA